MSRVYWLTLAALILAPVGSRSALAQETTTPPNDGFRVTSVGVSSTYFSQSVPGDIRTYGDVFLGSGDAVTGSGSLRWSRYRPKSLISVESVTLYGARIQEGISRNWNQDLSVGLSKTAHRWRFGVSGNGEIMNFDEALFSTTQAVRVVTSGANFPTLASTAFQGQPTDPLPNSAFQPDFTVERFLLGRRLASMSAEAGVSYVPSPRMSLGFFAGGGQLRHIKDTSDITGFEYPQSTTGHLGADLLYSPSRRTQFGVGANFGRSESAALRYDGASLTVSLNRTLRRRWFIATSISGGYTTTRLSGNKTIGYSGGFGLKTVSHTLIASYNRTVDNPWVVALGTPSYVGRTTQLTAAWYWSPPRSSWYSIGSFAYGILTTHLSRPDTSSAIATFGRHLGRNFSLNAEAAFSKVGARRYVQDGRQYHLQQNAYRLTFVWVPPFRTPRP